MMTGTALLYPGFCFTRITDFLCYMWIPDQLPKLPQNDAMQEPINYEDTYVDEKGGLDGLLHGFSDDQILDDFYSPALENFTYNKSIDYGLDSQTEYTLEEFYPDGTMLDPERLVAKKILTYVCPILLALGTAGNIMSLLVLLKLTARVLSSCYYLAVLTVLDLSLLYVRCGNLWIHAISGLDISSLLIYCSDASCKVYPFAFSCVFHMSRWLVVCVAIEGFIAAKMPEKTMKYCNHERAKGIMWLITVLLIWVNIHYFWSFERYPLKEGKVIQGYTCRFATQLTHEGRVHQHSEEFQKIIWPVLELLIGEMFPMIVIFVCTVTMTIKIRNGKHKGNKLHQSWRHKYIMNPSAHDNTYKMILALCYAYLFFTVPKSAFTIFKYLLETGKIATLKYEYSIENKVILAQGIFAVVDGCFYSLKFILYYASSASFRKEVAYLLRCCCCFRKVDSGLLLSNHVGNRSNRIQEQQQKEELLTEVRCTTI